MLGRIVGDHGADTLTRSMAASALGEIACSPGGDPGLPPSVADMLEDATRPAERAMVRQSAVRALGRAKATGAIDRLVALRDADEDPTVSVLAAQALTRITSEDFFDRAFLEDRVSGFIERATGYELVEETP